MVSESICKILLERINVVDEKLFPLAKYIYDIVYNEVLKENYNINILINLETIKKYYPYNNPKPLTIIAKFFEDDDKTKMLYDVQKIVINLNMFFESSESMNCSNILHELTHYVNDCEGTISDVRTPQIKNKLTENIYLLIYLLRDTECNARCSQFGFYLKQEPNIKDINDYEKITHVKKIESLIDYMLLNNINLKIFNNKTIKYYQNIYKKYKQKIFKIYYFYLKEKK